MPRWIANCPARRNDFHSHGHPDNRWWGRKSSRRSREKKQVNKTNSGVLPSHCSPNDVRDRTCPDLKVLKYVHHNERSKLDLRGDRPRQ